MELKGNGATYRKLEDLLNALHGKANGEQAKLLQRLQEEVEVDKSYFLCHLLEVHGQLVETVGRREQEAKEGQVVNPTKTKSKDFWENDLPESLIKGTPFVTYSHSRSQRRLYPPPTRRNEQGLESSSGCKESDTIPDCISPVTENTSKGDLSGTIVDEILPEVCWDLQSYSSSVENLTPSRCSEDDMEDGSGADHEYLVQQNSELLRGLEELEKTVATLREENILLRKSSCPETEEKVKRLRKKNAELAVIAKRLEERARKLQEANLKVVNAPIPIKPGAVEQYKRAFARQRARDLAQHADTLLSKDKEIAALQNECRQLEAKIGQAKGSPVPAAPLEFERLLRESQKEVLRLQRQLSVSSAQEQHSLEGPKEDKDEKEEKIICDTPHAVVDAVKGETTCGEEKEPRTQVIPEQDLGSAHQQEDRLEFLEGELSKKRKECEDIGHEVRKRQKKCLDLESQLEDERSKNERLAEEAELLRRKAQLLEQSHAENEELRDELSALSAQYSSVLEENQRLRAKLENLEQVLKHMREVAERRQQLELEHEQALAILKFKQDEIKRLQRAQLFAKREHEGVVQKLEKTLDCMQAKVQELEQKCRNQSEQFGLLSQELEKFRQQASKIDLSAPGLLCSGITLPNGLNLSTDTGTNASWDDIAFWSLEGNEALCDISEHDLAAVLRSGSAPYAAGLSRSERSPATKHRELPSPSLKSSSTSSTSPPKSTHLSPKSASDSRKASPTPEVDTASEVEELDIDVSPSPFPASRGAAKLQVFIARYSYNPYDGPNDNPEVELPLTAGEYIYVYGDMDDDGFYEGELMDGRRGLVPSNFVERVSDDDAHEAPDFSHNSFQESSFLSNSERLHQRQHHVRFGHSTTERTEASASSENTKTPTVPLCNGLDLDLDLEEEMGTNTVPHPCKLTLIKQLGKSIVVGWEAPPVVRIQSYNVYVDQELRLSVPTGNQTKAVLERLDLISRAHRVAVQSMTGHGTSDPLRCCMLIGKDVTPAPTDLKVERVMATSAHLTWLPSNSNYAHAVSLNGELRELAEAGRYSAHLGGLTPGLNYRVEVEAQLPTERRERKCAMTTFTTLAAGPPDAPLDVQLEQGPSPGIAQISWLPVTIDAAGTSNGVRVTGYTIYADKKKVLEVSSPTAGSALIGSSQIEALKSARELTVRTMSPHGESADSVPVNVPVKLPAIMAGSSTPLCQPVPGHASALPTGAANTEPVVDATLVSAAKTPTVALGSTPHGCSNTPKAATDDAPLPAASYVEAWANPAVAAQAACPLPGATANLPVSVPAPMVVPAPLPVPAPMPRATPLASTSSAHPSVVLTATPEPCRETESPVAKRPTPSVSDFLDEQCPSPHMSPLVPSIPQITAPGTDALNVHSKPPLRPASSSPVESETEGEVQSARLVSIEEFLRPEPQPRIKVYAGGLMDPPPDYHVDSSRSDLSDILEEEEEDLYSESAPDVTPKTSGPAGRVSSAAWEADSDEEVLGEVQKLHPHVYSNKQLFSIPEVTEEEDNSESEPRSRPGKPQPRAHEASFHPSSQYKAKIQDLNAQLRGTTQVRRRLGVHYANAIDATSCEDEDSDSSLYSGPCSRKVMMRQAHRAHHDRDRLRREALLRRQMASDQEAQRPYLLSRTVRHVKTPAVEIDVEYGTDNDDEPAGFQPGEVLVEQMSSEWWVEGGDRNFHHAAPKQLSKHAPPNVGSSIQHSWEAAGLGDSGAAWCSPKDFSPKLKSSETRVVADQVRIFVALFPYDPATMSPNRDAADEELPFKEGQIIKVYGEKDADGFYQGESGGRHGYVPCNMVSEIQVDDEETRAQLLHQGFLSTEGPIEKIGTCLLAQHPPRPAPPPKPRRSKKVESTAVWEDTSTIDSSSQENSRHLGVAMGTPTPRRMVAVFDYDPRESSPNADVEAELIFNAGDIIYVFGDMDDDGFFYGDLNGQKGLVPSNFLQAFPETREETVAEHRIPHSRRDSQVSQTASLRQPDPVTPSPQDESPRNHAEQSSSPDQHHNLRLDLCPELLPGPSSSTVPLSICVQPSDGHSLTNTSPPGKKKKGFFSKGKKLFKKLGSSKKE
ncbi:peripheral-type benzodiazepine receptor-associated protein 1-like [Trichomycterus rosablanca]|uniref:peripheral-type benzodiazepine receptor-associated protein 1-like n=1 Tax=Trichomycterus rosablanca TaxID=2290929 RepID=UPI002F35C4E3